MTPEEIKKIQDENIALKQQVNDLGVEKAKLITDISERDTKITTLEKNAQERGEQFKKFKDMNEAEKELLSEKEKELLQRQDALEEERQKDRQERLEFNKKQKDATISNLANRLSKGDKDIAEQIKINLGKLSPELLEKATTEEELTPYVQDAFNMTGIGNTQSNSLRDAINTDGLPAKIEGEKDFSDTQEGKQIGNALGLKSFSNDNNQQ
jgi:hypothetical protein